MKYKFPLTIILIFFYSYILFSQTFTICDTLKTPISNIHVFSGDNVIGITDFDGRIKINLKKYTDSFKLTHLSYKEIYLNAQLIKSVDTIYMYSSDNKLSEVLIKSRAKKNKNKKRIFLHPKTYFINGPSSNADTPLLFDHQTAVYIPNELKGEYKISKIVLKTELRRSNEFTPYSVHLMTVDTITKKPLEKIFSERIDSTNYRRVKEMVIDLSSKADIKMPKEGLAIVVETYNQKYYTENGYYNQVYFACVRLNKKSKFKYKEFRINKKYKNQIWQEPSYSQNGIQCFNFGIELIED